jgi:DNA-binding Lrp family transcriptional regulator
MILSDNQMRLIDGWQKGFPLEAEPYASIALGLGVSELSVLGMLTDLSRNGILSRVGAVVAPNTAGASTLAAMAVPPERLEEIAQIVNAEPGVNHNYEREHRFNLWFVVTGRDRKAVDGAIGRIESKAGYGVIDLPLRAAYHIDLGFPLGAMEKTARSRSSACQGMEACNEVTGEDLTLLQALENGLPIKTRPYKEIAERIGASEADVIARLQRLVQQGTVKRLGLVVRHHELGYRSNAMVVWDIPDEQVESIGEKFAGFPFVTLCYRRDRRRPHWPYNLFCMIHGRDRETVLKQVGELKACAGDMPHDILFSRRRFKQCGARLSAA